jgi:DoxX-like family
MDTIRIVLQIIVALGLLNVWLLRSGKKTPFRGKSAENIRAEFEAYGLPVWFMWVTGALKIGLAASLLAGIWIPALVQPAALVLILLMVGAFGMHLRVKDPFMAGVPALAMLAMAVAIALL